MKKSLLALAALSAFAGGAMAQSSVTLFGIVDLNVRNQDNSGSAGDITSLSTDGNASSRLGFRGVEDLGGGLRAGFWLEGALAADTGNAAGQTWQRRSTVSLLGGFGEIRLGRDYTPTFWNHTVFDPFGTNGVGSQTNLMTEQPLTTTPTVNRTVVDSSASTLVRANNTVGYFLPSLGGVYGQVQASLGEGTTGNKYYGGRIGYGAGPVNVAIAYGVTEQTGTMVDDLKAFNIGGSFNAGFATFYGQYHKYEYSTRELQNFMIGVGVPIGAGTLKASYGKTDYNTGSSEPGADQIAVGYVYDLSKRTAVYAHYSKISNDAGLRFTTSGSGALPGAPGGFDSQGFEFGVRHSF